MIGILRSLGWIERDGTVSFMSCYVSSDRGFVAIALPRTRKEDRGRDALSIGPFTGHTLCEVSLVGVVEPPTIIIAQEFSLRNTKVKNKIRLKSLSLCAQLPELVSIPKSRIETLHEVINTDIPKYSSSRRLEHISTR